MATVMVVDDAQFMRVRLGKLLTESGYSVLEAENGVQAVELYRSHRPEAVLMDITMPQMDGLQALAEIRQWDPTARVVMLTALGQQSMVMQAVQSGARDFLVKPFDPDRVLIALRKVLE